MNKLDPAGVLPERPYTRDELHAYLVHLRKKCQTTIAGLSDEQAHQQVDFPWTLGNPISFLELLLYTMRHGPRTCGPVEPVSRTERHSWSL
jgi:DinB superfamily